MSPRPARSSLALRQAALAAVIGAVGLGIVARVLGLGDSVAVVFDRYRTLFMPARYGFAIWLVIHAAFIAYAAVIRRPSRLAEAGHDAQAKLLIVASVLGPAWIVAFRFDLISLSMLLMIAMVVVALALFVDAHDLCRRERLCGVWTVPFALYLGWIGVSTLINFGVWLVAIGWRGGGVDETQLALAMIVAGSVFGIGIGLRFADAVVPMAVSWAMFAIFAAQSTNLAVAIGAFAAGTACAVGAALALWKSVSHARHAHPPTHIALIGTR